MAPHPAPMRVDLPPELKLPVSLLSRYFYFLTRRPISQSNPHYLQQRLEGLKSLAPLLSGTGIACLDDAVHHLRALNPANFQRLAERLQYDLLPVSASTLDLPRPVVVSDSAPPPGFVADAEHIRIILGPGIGIGDEIISFPLARQLKTLNPAVRISVLSAYSGLWDRVLDVDAVGVYTDCIGLLQALRGEAPHGTADLVLLVDFERPDLHPAVCFESGPSRYAELSLGAQSLFAVDRGAGCLYRAPRAAPYFANYYHGFDYLTGWLGLPPAGASRHQRLLRRESHPPDDQLRVYVNPFTSKVDPSPVYWSRLLADVFVGELAGRVRIVVDRGPNAATARFAHAVARSAGARVGAGIEVAVAGGAPSIGGVMAALEQAQVVVCSDSFAAHAAPHFGCLTLVVAGPGLEGWRAPYPGSFYLDAGAPLATTAGAMRVVLRWALGDGAGLPRATAAERDLDRISRQLESCNGAGAGRLETLAEGCHAFSREFRAVVGGLAEWPGEAQGLLADVGYAGWVDTLWPVTPDARHVQDRLQQWENTNLRKALSLRAAAQAEHHAPPGRQVVAAADASPLRRDP